MMRGKINRIKSRSKTQRTKWRIPQRMDKIQLEDIWDSQVGLVPEIIWYPLPSSHWCLSLHFPYPILSLISPTPKMKDQGSLRQQGRICMGMCLEQCPGERGRDTPQLRGKVLCDAREMKGCKSSGRPSGFALSSVAFFTFPYLPQSWKFTNPNSFVSTYLKIVLTWILIRGWMGYLIFTASKTQQKNPLTNISLIFTLFNICLAMLPLTCLILCSIENQKNNDL